MKTELEALSHKQLISIAKNYGLRNTESMSEKEIIKRILEIEGIEHKQEKEVKLKRSFPWLMTFIFVMLLIIELTGSIMPMFNRFYFDFNTGQHWIYLTIMNAMGILWMLYIWYRWFKYGQLHMWIFISLIMGLGYDGYYLFQLYDTVKIFAGYTGTLHHMNELATVFWAWVGILGGSTIILGSLFLIKTVNDKA